MATMFLSYLFGIMSVGMTLSGLLRIRRIKSRRHQKSLRGCRKLKQCSKNRQEFSPDSSFVDECVYIEDQAWCLQWDRFFVTHCDHLHVGSVPGKNHQRNKEIHTGHIQIHKNQIRSKI